MTPYSCPLQEQLSSELGGIAGTVEALGSFLRDAASLMEEVRPSFPCPLPTPTVPLGAPVPHCPSPLPSRSPQVSSMTSLAELRQEIVGLRAPNTSTGAFTAVSRIACGHPEGGGLRIPSLNWYEDNDVKAFLDRNSSEQRPVASGSTSEWGAVGSSARGSGGHWGLLVRAQLCTPRSLLPGAAPQPGVQPPLTDLLAGDQASLCGEDPVHPTWAWPRQCHG